MQVHAAVHADTPRPQRVLARHRCVLHRARPQHVSDPGRPLQRDLFPLLSHGVGCMELSFTLQQAETHTWAESWPPRKFWTTTEML